MRPAVRRGSAPAGTVRTASAAPPSSFASAVAAPALYRQFSPRSPPEAARRNAPFAFLLYGVLLGGPWIGGTLAGRAIGRARRGRADP